MVLNKREEISTIWLLEEALNRIISKPDLSPKSSLYLSFYEENAIGESATEKGFFRFKKSHCDMNDSPRSGGPSDFDIDRLNALIIHINQPEMKDYRPYYSICILWAIWCLIREQPKISVSTFVLLC